MPKNEIITEIEGRKLKLSNLEKVLYPQAEVTKAEFIQYFIKIAPYLLRYISHRPLTQIRFPDGIEGNRFYSKNKPNWTPSWIGTVKVDPDDDITYVMANDTASLVWMANLATLELHPMQVKDAHPHRPDHFIFDLDPPPSSDFEVVKQLALRLKPFLESYGYHPFIKTSGSKGLHIYVPITPQYDQETFITSIKKLAKEYISTDNITTLKINKQARKGKVLLDIYRNHKSQTCVAPYSTRGKAGAPVSTPISWDELKNLTTSKAFNIRSIFDILIQRGDPWENIYDYAVPLHDQSLAHTVKIPEKLKNYDQKRDFSKTGEPAPEPVPSHTPGNRYVIQIHDASNLHYDLRLEDNGVLLSWAIPKGLPIHAKEKRLAIHTEPHPLKYLSFEGTIPKNEYGGGQMWIFDHGEYEYIKKEDKKITIHLKNGKLAGIFTLVNTKKNQWLISRKDDNKIITSLDARPMLAAMGDKIPSGSTHFFEIKWDGIRCIATKDGKSVTLTSRGGKDLTGKFPKIVEALKEIEPQHIVVDGEIVALNDDGTPNFSKVISRMHKTGKDAILRASEKIKTVLYLFDCLELDGRDIRQETNVRRREWLRINMDVTQHLRLSESFEDGHQLFEAIKAQGMEGIMCKKKSGKYHSGKRTDDWTKIKVSRTDQALIIGYTAGEGDRTGSIGALHLAKIEGDILVYYGKVGTGFDQKKLKDILEKLKKVPTTKKPIKEPIEEAHRTTWIEPIYTCEIKYASMTSNHTYREPVFIKMFETPD